MSRPLPSVRAFRLSVIRHLEHKHITQTDLANALGYSKSAVCRMLQTDRVMSRIPLETAERIAEVFRVPLGTLFHKWDS